MTAAEHELEALIREFRGRLPMPAIQASIDLLYNGEPGAALEQMCMRIGEAGLKIGAAELGTIKRLGGVWQVDEQCWSGLPADK